MQLLINILFLAFFGIGVWYFRAFIREYIEYRVARRAEIKRRLQVEHKQEQALKQLLNQPMDDAEKFRLVQKFANERHERAVKYVIQDMFEHKS